MQINFRIINTNQTCNLTLNIAFLLILPLLLLLLLLPDSSAPYLPFAMNIENIFINTKNIWHRMNNALILPPWHKVFTAACNCCNSTLSA